MSTYNIGIEIERIKEPLVQYAYYLTKDKEAAKDLYQDSLLMAIRKAHHFEIGSNLGAWMRTIIKNTFINNFRKNSKMPITNDFYDFAGTSKNNAEDQLHLKDLLSMINSLDERLREPFILHSQGFRYEEIAHKLGVSLGTIKSRIYYARQTLQREISRSAIRA